MQRNSTEVKESQKKSWFKIAKSKDWVGNQKVIIKKIEPTTPVLKNNMEIHRAKILFESEDGFQISKTFLLYDYSDNPLCQIVKATLDVGLDDVEPDMLIDKEVIITFKKESIDKKEYLNVVSARGVENEIQDIKE